MACRAVAFRSVIFAEPWRPVNLGRSSVRSSLRVLGAKLRLFGKFRPVRAREFHSASRTRQLRCCHGETSESSSQEEQGPPQEVVLKAISGLLFESFDLFFFVFISVNQCRCCFDNGVLWEQRCRRQKGGLVRQRMW